ncbi:MAG: triose-phosphate isomerase [Nannocystaceae bacterium]
MESPKKMTRRQRWVVGNWKQHLLRKDAETLAHDLVAALPPTVLDRDDSVHVGIAPTFVALDSASPWSRPAGPLWLFSQNVAAQETGAFTGEVGPAMVLDAGARGAIVGHSERRKHYGEDDTLIASKVRGALDAGLRVILCVGEPLEVRQSGAHESHVIAQLSAGLSHLDPEHIGDHLVIAYEPVWAIGTGVAATPDDAAAMHRRIRSWLTEHYSQPGADRSILYGGSVKADNAAELIAAGDIDGFLVGGASLRVDTFLPIIKSAASE